MPPKEDLFSRTTSGTATNNRAAGKGTLSIASGKGSTSRECRPKLPGPAPPLMVARASREPQQPPPTRVSGKKGGLQDHLAEWVAAGATPWVLKTIKEGLQLRWKEKPPQQVQVAIPEGRCPPELEMTMNKQAQKGLWREVQPGDEVKMVSKAFAIPKGKGEGFRLLVDHSRLSKYLLAPHFKMGASEMLWLF